MTALGISKRQEFYNRERRHWRGADAVFTYHGAGKKHLYVIKCLKQYWRKSMNYTEKEKEYFNNKLSQVIYNPNRFKVLIGEDRFLFGVVSAGDSEAPLAD